MKDEEDDIRKGRGRNIPCRGTACTGSGTGMYGLEEGSRQKTQVEQKVGTSLGRARIPR